MAYQAVALRTTYERCFDLTLPPNISCLDQDTVEENDAEVEKAAKEAVAAVRKEHPELKDDLEKIASVRLHSRVTLISLAATG